MKSSLAHFVLALAMAAACCAVGCSPKEVKIPTAYGSRNGFEMTSSVNGTHVLGELFRHAGYSVRSSNRLSPRIDSSDVIVWIPDSFDPPAQNVRDYLEDWLTEQPGRTLIYVDRDFDAAIEYWNAMLKNGSAEDRLVAQREKGRAQHDYDFIANASDGAFDCEWYSVDRDQPLRRPKQLVGRYAEAINPAKTDLVLRSRIALSKDWESANSANLADKLPNSEILLSTKDGLDPIVIRYSDEYDEYDVGSQLIIVNNGSFLLNQPLVNHEHRKLAAALIEECGSYGETVTFLESNDQGVEIVAASDVSAGRSGWEWLTVWPISPLGLHIALLLIVFCFASFPIFGRPKRLPETRSSDFQKHIGALGELLEATDDYDYAQLRVRQYQQIARGDTVYRRVGRARAKPSN